MFDKKTCNQEGCNANALTGSLFCQKHINDLSSFLKELQISFESRQKLENLRLEQIKLENWNLKGKILSYCFFKDITFIDCCLDNQNVSFTYFINCNFQNCSLKESQLYYSSFASSIMQNCSLDESDFKFCNFNCFTAKDSHFIENSFLGSHFLHSRLENINMADCDLKSVIFALDKSSSANFKKSNAEDACFLGGKK